ncbi:hypothetical protein QL996_06310 [Planococcus sp. APC 4015]|nr:hypothetical protein [Planococcus sp. APC 4015]
MTRDDPAPRSVLSTLRRVIVAVIVVSFALAAIGGIVVLLSGSLDETAGRVLGTTAVIGAFSVAVLCCAALAGRRLQTFGMLGAAVSVLAAILSIWAIWSGGYLGDGFYQSLSTAIAATAAFSLASLLLLLADRRQTAVRVGLTITLALFAVVLAMVVYLIWWSDTVDDEVFPRALGIAGILAALGAVVVPVISLLLRDRPAVAGLPPASVARLEAEAARRGVTLERLVDELLDGAAPG